MKQEHYKFSFDVYDSISELSEADAWLLREAQEVTGLAYAPYSNFNVGAVAKLTNGEIVAGSNQENASYPVGICAERVLLGSISSLYPRVPVESIAISYQSDSVISDHPIAPCGMCRQSLQEYESRTKHSIRLILGGLEGKIYIIPSTTILLPFSFTNEDLK
jgi:cytidine deaminase